MFQPSLKPTSSSSNGKTLAMVTGLIIIAIIFFLLYPSLTRIAAIGAAITETRTDLQQKQVRDYSLQDLIAAYRRYEPVISELEKSVRARSRELEFITTLETLAEQNRLQQKISVGSYEPLDTLPFHRLSLHIVIEGDFVNTLRYLQELETLPSYVNIISLQMTAERAPQSATDNNTPVAPRRLKTSITADTFWQ